MRFTSRWIAPLGPGRSRDVEAAPSIHARMQFALDEIGKGATFTQGLGAGC
jgi:hypothetical protein